ncbi:MAG: hypothetical protein KAR06_03035 [Deltaproteobacteria bacterium]|nr:hypothetical protein [Deltaproteobacteria bacterium]
MADQYTRRTMQAVLGLTVVYTIYPVVGAAVTVGSVVTSGAGAYGAVKELIAAAGIAAEYWVCALDFDTAGAAQVYRLEVGTGAAGVYTIARMEVQVDVTAVTMNLSRYMIGPYPAYVAGGTQLVARATGAAAKVIGVSTTIATGL